MDTINPESALEPVETGSQDIQSTQLEVIQLPETKPNSG